MCWNCCRFVKLSPELIQLIYGESVSPTDDIVGSITNVQDALPLLHEDATEDEWEQYRNEWGPKILKLEEVSPPDEHWKIWQDAGKHLYRRI